jgi:signal transduction histidine kinase/ActR/RegA family two-component response regulator
MVIVMAATFAALAFSAVALFVYEVRKYRSDTLDDLASQADLIAQSVAPTLSFDDPKAATEALAALKLRPQVRAAAVYSARGSLFATYTAAGARVDQLPQAPAAAGSSFEVEDLALFHPVERDGEVLGTVYLRARHDMTERLVDYLLIVCAAAAAGLGLAWLIFRQLHPAVTRPILAVAEAARRVVDDRDYDIRVTETSDDEVGVLVDAFNAMLRELSAEMHERRSAEEALREADRRKDEFLATLAHELRNPLAPLSNALSLMRRADDQPQVRAKARAMMERQLAQMVRLIDDLIEVSRITRGRLELRLQTVDLVGVARSALEASGPALVGRRHRVTEQLPGTPVWVHADAARLTQVFVNLLNNAAKYTAAGGSITLQVSESAGQARVSVTDNGVGISAADQERIFSMFVQLDTSLERGAAGLGVGLTIAQQLVAMHGGKLAVESGGAGQGSTFSVSLPTVAPPVMPDAPVTPPQHAASSDGLRILVADDNVDFATSMGELLRQEGHVVEVVYDGGAALRAASEGPPDVAFFDIGMPGLNGYELASRLRESEHTRAMVLVAVTGWGQESDKQRVRSAGYDHHWVKPIEADRAIQLLQAVRAQKRIAAPALPDG